MIGYTDSTKSIAKTQSCSGTVESVVETETDTDFAHAKGTQRFAVRVLIVLSSYCVIMSGKFLFILG